MSARIRTVVVGVATITSDDPTRGGEDPVLAPAVELARSLGATLHVVHAFELPDLVLAGYPEYLPYADPAFHAQYARELRARLEARAARFGYADVRCHAVEGSAGRTLVEVAEEVKADLLVVGATRRGRVWRNLLGTTADRVIRGARVPVLVLHQPFAAPIRRVLLTTDLSEESGRLHDRGLATAAALFGEALEVRTLLVVWFDVMLPPPLREDALRAAATTELSRFLVGRGGAAPIHPRVRFGEPAREIVAEADEWKADLVVMGTHGRSGFSRLALGSTAAATLRGAGCNVLVVPRERAPAVRAAPPPPRAEVAQPA
jgi:nucleotide-binding universal stress UspA family protein